MVFSNVFQISNLNEGMIAMAILQAIFTCYTINHRESECKDLDLYALRRNPTRVHSSSSSVRIAASNFLSVCIFPEILEEKSRLAN